MLCVEVGWSGSEHPPLKSHRMGLTDLALLLMWRWPWKAFELLSPPLWRKGVGLDDLSRTLFSSSWQEDPVAKANTPRLQVSLVSKSKSEKGGVHSQSTSCPCSSAGWHPLQPSTPRCYNPHHKPVSWKSKPGDCLTSKAIFKGTDEATQAFVKERGWPSSGNHLLRSVRSLPRWLSTCKILWRLIHGLNLRHVSCFMKVIMMYWGK